MSLFQSSSAMFFLSSYNSVQRLLMAYCIGEKHRLKQLNLWLIHLSAMLLKKDKV